MLILLNKKDWNATGRFCYEIRKLLLEFRLRHLLLERKSVTYYDDPVDLKLRKGPSQAVDKFKPIPDFFSNPDDWQFELAKGLGTSVQARNHPASMKAAISMEEEDEQLGTRAVLQEHEVYVKTLAKHQSIKTLTGDDKFSKAVVGVS